MNNLGNVIDYVPDWQFVSVNANAEWAAAHRDLLVRFLRVLLRATEWLYGNRAAASAIAARELPAPLGHAERAWDRFTGTNALTRDMSINIRGARRTSSPRCANPGTCLMERSPILASTSTADICRRPGQG